MNEVLRFMEIYDNREIGISIYGPLLVMVNEDKHIVKELTKDQDHYHSLWSFLDSTFLKLLDTIHTKDEQHVLWLVELVLNAWNELDEKTKWTINSNEFAKYIRDRM